MTKTTIKIIQVWETTDGERFDVQEEAYEHQDWLACRARVDQFVHDKLSDLSVTHQVLAADVLSDNLEELYHMYTDSKCLNTQA